jgi:hypothetical protein
VGDEEGDELDEENESDADSDEEGEDVVDQVELITATSTSEASLKELLQSRDRQRTQIHPTLIASRSKVDEADCGKAATSARV